jgi:hypothetical protein
MQSFCLPCFSYWLLHEPASLTVKESFIYPTDAQLDCSKNAEIYMRDAPTCFGFP